MTVSGQAAEIQRQVPEIPLANYLIEPAPRGTASVVGLAAVALLKRDPDAVMAVLPSDHYIRDRDLFIYVLREAFEVAREGYLVTLGITPVSPSTAYGYVQQGKPLDEHLKYPVYHVKRFTEKPDEKTAQRFPAIPGAFVEQRHVRLAGRSDPARRFDRQMPDLSAALDVRVSRLGNRRTGTVRSRQPGRP